MNPNEIDLSIFDGRVVILTPPSGSRLGVEETAKLAGRLLALANELDPGFNDPKEPPAPVEDAPATKRGRKGS